MHFLEEERLSDILGCTGHFLKRMRNLLDVSVGFSLDKVTLP